MNKEEKRKEFLETLKTITNHMNWCKIKVDPEDSEKINDPRIQYDYVAWKTDDDSIVDKIHEIEGFNQLCLIEKILIVHCMVCEHFVFDEFCYFLGKYDREKNICTIDQKYGRNPNRRWIEERKKHNRRICFELSRYFAFRMKQLTNEECDIVLVSDELESHYATGIICDDFMITIDCDDFIKGGDLNRVKLGLEIKGITIVNDEKGIIKKAIDKFNLNRKPKKEFEKEVIEDFEKNGEYEWISILLSKTKDAGNNGVFKYIKPILEFKGYEPKKIWLKVGDKYIQTLYIAWNMNYITINSLGVELISSRKFFDNIQDGLYLPNKNRSEIAKEIVYYG